MTGPADEPPAPDVPRQLRALCDALLHAPVGTLRDQLDLAEELHGAIGVWIDQLRTERRHQIRDLHRQI